MRWILARKPQPDVWKGLVAGAAGGIGATVAMTAFQSLWTYVDHKLREGSETDGNGRAETAWTGIDREREKDEPEQPPARVAERFSEGFFGYELDERQKKAAGIAVHLGFGTAVGAVYGSVAEFSPQITRGDGIPFGTGLMVVADEVAVPAMGLSPSPRNVPISTHLYALCSHVVYGYVLETLRKSVRRAL